VKTASGLTLLAIGAVLAFAVHGHPWFINLQVVGWIIMVVGLVGMFVPRSGYGWLRRQMVTRTGPDGRSRVSIRQKRYPPYIMINPKAVAAESAGAGGTATATMPEMPADHDTFAEPRGGVVREEVVEEVVPDEELVDEYFEEK
jgi:ABC-type transport system involved in cytochrome bd biosynthesis fused ATPase/permease subunit